MQLSLNSRMDILFQYLYLHRSLLSIFKSSHNMQESEHSVLTLLLLALMMNLDLNSTESTHQANLLGSEQLLLDQKSKKQWHN